MDKQKIKKCLVKQWKDWRWFVFLILFVIVPVKSSLADWNWVPTGSMNPTIVEGDMVFVNKTAYDLRVPLTFLRIARWDDPDRGEIIVVFSPEDGKRLVKRVVGVPGDEIEMKNNVLFVNGKEIQTTSLPGSHGRDLPHQLRMMSKFAEEDLAGIRHSVMFLPGIDTGHRSFSRRVVPSGKYFVMGDSRDNSYDSRAFGFVDRDSIVGKANAVMVSFNKSESWRPRWNRFFSSLYQ